MMRSALFLAIASCPLASGGVLLNGSFESGGQDDPGRYDIAELTDWTASGGSMLLEHDVNEVSNIEAHSGSQFVSMGHNGSVGDTLSQTFETVVGQNYEVSFFIRSVEGNALQGLFASVTDGAGGGELGSITALDFGFGAGWTEYSFSFTGASESATLTLLHALGSFQSNLAVDTVTVDIPAPGVLAMIGLGLVVWRRR
jgi:hypothetical protein